MPSACAARVLRLAPTNAGGGGRSLAVRESVHRLEMLSKEALKFCDGDEPLTPRRLDGARHGNKAAIDRRDTDAESLGRLLAAVREPVDLVRLPQVAWWSPAN